MIATECQLLVPGVDSASSKGSQGPATSAVAAALTEHRSEFLRFLMRRLKDRDTAEDVLQGFCLRVITNAGGLEKSDSVIAWLYTVLRSTLTDHYRREAARRRREGRYLKDWTALREKPGEVEHEGRLCGCLGEVFSTLPPDYAEILRRIDLSDEPREKTIAELRITPANARVRLHRARRALRAAMGKCCGSCCENGFRNCTCGDRHRPFSVADLNRIGFS